jgi:phosphatidate cytidylyltransferase
MNNTGQRLLLFFIAVPLLLLGIFFLPFYHYAALVAVILVFTGGAAVELANIFLASGVRVRRPVFLAIGSGLPLLFFASTFLPDKGHDFLLISIGILALVLFAPFAFTRKEAIPGVLAKASAYGLGLVYSGILGGFVILIVSGQQMAREALLSFALIVLANDSLAWLFGSLFGRKRNLVAVSPNKSLAGFLGGLGGSTGCALLMRFVFPTAFPVPVWVVAVIGLATGFAVILGDLFESALKRSAGTKDSGNGIPGRGGFLDSFDSELFAAPVFYAAIVLFGLFR